MYEWILIYDTGDTKKVSANEITDLIYDETISLDCVVSIIKI